jgi:hypothetical protein
MNLSISFLRQPSRWHGICSAFALIAPTIVKEMLKITKSNGSIERRARGVVQNEGERSIRRCKISEKIMDTIEINRIFLMNRMVTIMITMCKTVLNVASGKQLGSINAIVPNAGQKWTAILPTQKLGSY